MVPLKKLGGRAPGTVHVRSVCMCVNAGFIASGPIIRMQFQWQIRYICRLNQLCMIQLAIGQMTSILGIDKFGTYACTIILMILVLINNLVEIMILILKFHKFTCSKVFVMYYIIIIWSICAIPTWLYATCIIYGSRPWNIILVAKSLFSKCIYKFVQNAQVPLWMTSSHATLIMCTVYILLPLLHAYNHQHSSIPNIIITNKAA